MPKPTIEQVIARLIASTINSHSLSCEMCDKTLCYPFIVDYSPNLKEIVFVCQPFEEFAKKMECEDEKQY